VDLSGPGGLRPKSFVVRYVTLFIGEAFSKLCVLGAFAYLARVISPAELGLVELALSITVFFLLGVESGMGLYGARIVAASPGEIPRLVPQVMLLRGLLGVPAYLVMLLVATYYRSAGLGLLAIYGAGVFITPFLTQWVFQGLRQMQWVAAGTATRNFVFVALVLVFMRAGSDVRWVAAAEVAGMIALASFNTFILHRRLRVDLVWSGAAAGTVRLFKDVWWLGLGDFSWACLWYAPGVITGWMSLSNTEDVAWIGAAVRIVLALHTFVFLYFFNLLPNLARELAGGRDGWRRLVTESMRTSMWPALLIALGGTFAAPILMPLVFGPAYAEAVRPFQIAVWMIPVAWFSGHFRFSLIAAGKQRWESAASALTAVVTVTCALVFVPAWSSTGAAAALLAGGVVNAILALVAMRQQVGDFAAFGSARRALAATVAGLAAGVALTVAAGPLAGTAAACLVAGGSGVREMGEFLRQRRG
jgi:O-antigen/teichoic acid export membrane protein